MSIDLKSRYLGLELANPVVASASTLTGSVDSLKRLEDAGVGAVVLPSLFEEQIEHGEMAAHNLMLYGAELSPEARGFFDSWSWTAASPYVIVPWTGYSILTLGTPLTLDDTLWLTSWMSDYTPPTSALQDNFFRVDSPVRLYFQE